MSSIKRAASGFRAVLGAISKLSLFAMMILIFTSSLGRYLLGQPIPSTITIVQLVLLPTVIWLYAPEVQFTESNITMDLVSNQLSETVNRVIKLLFYPFVLFLLYITFEALLKSTITLWNDQVWTSGTISLPAYATRGLITVGVLLLAATIALQIAVWIKDMFEETQFSQFTAQGGQKDD
jgi:TRAP-type C4-dicarboxylate transport system permease small subunit